MSFEDTIERVGDAMINLINSKTVYQPLTMLSNGTIALENKPTIYKITPLANTTFTFSTTNLTLANTKSYTFELCVDMSTAYSLTFPASVAWQDGETPDLSEAGTYFLVFRSIDGGTTWLGNLQGKWN